MIILCTYSDITGRKSYLVVFALFIILSGLTLIFIPPLFFSCLIAVMLAKSTERSVWIFGKIFSIEGFVGEKGKSYGYFGAEVLTGALVGYFVAGDFLEIGGVKISLLISVIIGAFSLLPLIGVRETMRRVGVFSLKRVLTRTFMGYTLHRFLYLVSRGIVMAITIPLYFKNVLLLPYFTIGLAIATHRSGMVLGFLSGKLSDVYNFKKISYASYLVYGLLLFTLNLSKILIFVVLILFICDLSAGIAATALPYFYEHVSTKLGRDILIIESVGTTMGLAFGSLIAGYVISTFGYPLTFTLGGVFAILSLLTLFSVFR